MAVINSSQGGEATSSITRGTLCRIDDITAPAEMLQRLDVLSGPGQNRNPGADAGMTTLRGSILSNMFEARGSEREPAWSADAMNACWTAG